MTGDADWANSATDGVIKSIQTVECHQLIHGDVLFDTAMGVEQCNGPLMMQ